MSRPRAFLFSPYITAFGGVERLLITLATAAGQSGFEVTVAAFECTADLQQYAPCKLETVSLSPHRGPLSEARALRSFVRSNPDARLLFFDLKSAFYAGLSHLNGFALHLTDPPSLLPRDVTKYAFSNRDVFPDLAVPRALQMRGEIAHRITRRGVRRASRVVVMTRRIARELEALYGVHATIVRPGIELPKRLSRAAADSEHTTLLSVARLAASKRISLLIESLARLPQSWRLDVVGSGPDLEELRNLAAHLAVADRVTFHGHVTDAQLECLYAGADMFVMPAVQGYGLPALEALARRVPVVLHADSGVSEVLEGSPWVRTVSTYEPLELAQLLRDFAPTSGALSEETLPAIPTGRTWSLEVMRAVGWL